MKTATTAPFHRSAAWIPFLALAMMGCTADAGQDADDEVDAQDITEAQKADSTFTDLGEGCTKVPGQGDFANVECKGAGPYKLLLLTGPDVTGLQVEKGELKQGLGLSSNPTLRAFHFRSLGQKAEWRHPRGNAGAPHALIVRVVAANENLNDSVTHQFLTITKLNGERPCLFRVINANQDGANEKARAWAERARKASRCQ